MLRCIFMVCYFYSLMLTIFQHKRELHCFLLCNFDSITQASTQIHKHLKQMAGNFERINIRVRTTEE